jgi:DNA-binding CsgD family transcriptional regulator
MTYKDKIIELHKSGVKTYKEIAEAVGCSKATVTYYLGEGQSEKRANRQKQTRHKIREFLKEYKQSRGCSDCGEFYPYWMLEFDHLKNKQFQLSSYKEHTQDIEKVREEISKCDVVCSNCHKDRTYRRAMKHGHTIDLDGFYEKML